MKGHDWQLSPARKWAGRHIRRNTTPWLRCLVASVQTLACADPRPDVSSTKWQRLYPGYFSFILYSVRNLQHVIHTGYEDYMTTAVA